MEQPVTRALGVLAVALVGAACAETPPPERGHPFLDADRKPLGAGAFLVGLPRGEKGPSDKLGAPARPKVTADFTGPPPTNDWWSSLIWAYDPADPAAPFSQPMFPHPLAVQAEAGGLGLAYPTRPVIDERGYFFPYAKELLVGVEGLAARQTQVAGASDWVVTAEWSDDHRTLRATFGHGLPFVYCQARGGRPVVELPAAARVWRLEGATAAVTVEGHAYGLFLPTGGRWSREGSRLLGASATAFSVGVLPDESAASLALFRAHAFAFVTDSQVSWAYDEPSATLTTTFKVRTADQDPAGHTAPEPLLALYPHQWRHSELPRTLGNYTSPRGRMPLIAAASFRTRLPFTGVLPVLPPTAGPDRGTLRAEIEAAWKDGPLFPPGPEGTRGTYWTGKALQRAALVAWLADQIGYPEARDALVRAIEQQLERWFDGQPPEAFAYDPTWHTLVGVPSEYHSGWELNDHHFHHGYFVFAAATVARFDPGWVAPDRWGALVDLLIGDVASAERPDQSGRFPFLRNFDPYAGHSWANGPALFRRGNNEESSSEEMNFATATLLWGALTGRPATRDLGIFLHAQAASAIEQYWFDVDRSVFPPGFDRPAVGIVWGSGAAYDTWWDRNPVYVHAINFLPFTGGSLYLGRDASYAAENERRLEAANGGEVRLWRDLVWMHLALSDPRRAAALYQKDHYFDPERGDSMAFAYHWIQSMRALGRVDASVRADLPTYAVFQDGATRSHAAFNPGPGPRRVTFSDGASLELPAGATRMVETKVAPR
jgi:endoglucanase Acf2